MKSTNNLNKFYNHLNKYKLRKNEVNNTSIKSIRNGTLKKT